MTRMGSGKRQAASGAGRPVRWAPVVVAALGVLGCENAGEDRILSIETTGFVSGLVFFDGNGNKAPDGADSALADIGVRLVVRGARDTLAEVRSDANGAYRIPDVPVGRYRIVVDTATLGDTVRVVPIDSTDIDVGPGDSIRVRVAVTYPTVTVSEVRGLATGVRVFVQAIALNPPELFGDTTVHLVDSSGTVRATRIGPGPRFGAGDSLRLLGRRSTRAGEPTLDNVSVFFLGIGLIPPAPQVSTAAGATAATGTLDAALVRVVDATIADDTATVQGDYRFTADDGSGPLLVVLDRDARLDTAPYVPGAVIDALGLLVPDGSGVWQLKPRFNTDLLVK